MDWGTGVGGGRGVRYDILWEEKTTNPIGRSDGQRCLSATIHGLYK